MDKSFLDIAGCKSSFEPILRQKNFRGFWENRKKRRSFRKPAFEFAVSKGSGKQYCMQFIPLAVLKRLFDERTRQEDLIACNPYRLRYFFYFSVRFFQTAAFFMA